MRANASEVGQKWGQKKAVAMSMYQTYKQAKKLKKEEEQK